MTQHPFHHSDADRLNTLLDALASGKRAPDATASDLDANAAAHRLVSGDAAADASATPSEETLDDIWRNIMQVPATVPASTEGFRTPISARQKARLNAVPEHPRPSRFQSLASIAAVAAMLIVMIGAAWFSGGDGGPEHNPVRLAAISPDDATPVTGDIPTADPGDILLYSAGFDPEADHDVITLDGLPPVSDYAAIAGDVLVVANPYSDSNETRLFAVNLSSGSLMWASDMIVLWDFVASDNRIFGAFAQPGTDSYAMMSLSIETGEVLWTGAPMVELGGEQDIVPPGLARDLFRPVVIEDTIYYTNQDGQIIARDAYDGDILWSTPLEHLSAEETAGNAGQVVGDTQHIYAADRRNSIRKLDRHTGEEIDRFVLAERPAPDFVVDIHLTSDTLIVMSHSQELTSSFVDAISTQTGEVLWSHSLGVAGAMITSTGDVVAIPRQTTPDEDGSASGTITTSGVYVDFFDLDTGDQIMTYGLSSQAYATVSSSGSVVCMNEGIAINCADASDHTVVPVMLPYVPGEDLISPLLFWENTAIVLSAQDGITLIQPKRAEPSTPEARATSSSVGH